MTTVIGDPYRNLLRAATSEAHARVDACFPLGLRDAGAYRRYLLGMQALVAAAEHGLAAADLDACWAAWKRPARIDWLLDDLRVTGARALPAGATLEIADSASAAGVLYVLEGSALGASQLLRDVAALGHSAMLGARFLAHHGGGGSGARWREYTRCLADARFDARQEAAMLDAAARAFAFAEHEFARAEQFGGVDA